MKKQKLTPEQREAISIKSKDCLFAIIWIACVISVATPLIVKYYNR